MSDVLYMAARYLAFHRWKTTILVLSIALILSVPAGLRVVVRQSRQQLMARAEATPLLIGAPGSPLELVLNSLYARAEVPDELPYREVERVRETGLAEPIPLYVRFRAQDDPIVGTTLDYFEFRHLRPADGHPMVRLGDCVLGANVARRRGIGAGASVVSSPEGAFDLAGVYPLKMRVAGVLARSGTPDDDAIFVDLKTAWVIRGIGHGHENLSEASSGVVLRRGDDVVVGNDAVVEYNEVTDENIGSFHFHGDPETFPITAILAVPPDQRSAALLEGRYQASDEKLQIVRPAAVMEGLLATVLTVENYVVAALVMVGAAALATATLVFLLSARLRRREIETMIKLGGSRGRIAALLASEVVAVLVAAAGLAALLTWATNALGPGVVHRLIVG